MAIRFHLDEHVGHAVARSLIARGLFASTSAEARLLGEDDEDQLAFAVKEQRVLVTHDSDFTRIASTNADHWGICYCHGEKYTVGELQEMLVTVAECMTPEEMRGQFMFL